MSEFNADINSAGDGWIQVTISGDTANTLTEAQIASSLSTLPIAVEGKPVERVRHKKRGTEYTVIARGRLQVDGDLDNEKVVVYRGEDGQVWCRPEYEFKDGRFEALISSHGKAVAWQHPTAGWTSTDYYRVLMHCRNDGPFPVPLYTRPHPASTALVERLTKALEPFAKRAARWDDIPGIYRCHDNVELWQNGNWRCDLTVGDLREARSAIAAAKGESTDANS